MIIVPTYKRPEKLKNLIRCFKETETVTPVYLIIQGHPELYEGIEYPDNWTIDILKENIGLVAVCNYAFNKFPNEPWYGLICDDIEPKTLNWDTKLISHSKPYNIVSCKDTLNKDAWRISGIILWGGDLIRLCGFLCPPCTWHICGDDWWELVNRTCNIYTVFPEIESTHITPETTGIEADETYKSSYANFDGQVAQYNDWLQTQGNELLAKISQKIKECYETYDTQL